MIFLMLQLLESNMNEYLNFDIMVKDILER